MNPYAETELKTPKLDWNIEVQNIAVELTKPQVRFIWVFIALINLEFQWLLSSVIIPSPMLWWFFWFVMLRFDISPKNRLYVYF